MPSNPILAAALSLAPRKKRRKRRMPKQTWPSALQRRYAMLILELVDLVRGEMQGLLDALPRIISRRLDAEDTETIGQVLDDIVAAVRAKYDRTPAVRNMAKQISAYQAEQLGKQLESAFGFRIPIESDRVNQVVGEWLDHNVRLIKNVPEKLMSDLDRTIMEGIAQGKRHETLAKEIQSQFGFAEKRAKLIARDQVGKLYGQVNNARQRALGVSRYEWNSVGDQRVRSEHQERDGQIYEWGELPPDEEPGQPVQCFPGYTKFSSIAPISKIYRRVYTGKGSVIITADAVLHSTPNHPILTQRGWLAANDIKIGDYLVKTVSEAGQFGIKDRKNSIPSIMETFNALKPLGVVALSDSGGAGGFHGDPSVNNQVDIIDMDRLLRLDSEPLLSERGLEDLLTFADDLTLSFSQLYLSCGGRGIPSISFVRGACKALSLCLRGVSHPVEHSSAAISWVNSAADKLSANGCASDAVILRDLLNTPAGVIEGLRLVARILFGVVRRSILLTGVYTPSAEVFAEIIRVDFKNLGSLSERPGLYKLSRVTEKRVCGFSNTHVYNLETSSSWFIVENSVVHNCRCSASPVLDDLLDDLGI